MFKKIWNSVKRLFYKIRKCNFFDVQKIVAYLYSGDTLPKTLKSDEEQKLLILAEQGDNNAKQLLIEHNLRLVIYIAKKFENVNSEMEDLISIGSIGLIKAINSYNRDKNIKLATFASKCIENEILMHIRKISKQKQEISVDEPLSLDNEGNELVLCDVLPCESDDVEEDFEVSVEKQILWQVLGGMNSREQEIMCMRFGLKGKDELTQKEVADTLGISQSYISRLEKKIVSKIKKEMNKLA